MHCAKFNASDINPSLESYIVPMKPILFASSTLNLCPVYNSRIILSFPINFGIRCNVPTSAAKPISISLIQNQDFWEHNQISQALIKSNPALVEETVQWL